MKKRTNMLTKGTMAAVIAASAVVPVAAQAAEAEQSIKDVALKTEDGKIAKLSLEVYKKALAGKAIKTEDVTHVIANNGKAYPMEAYKKALAGAKGDTNLALETLEKKEANDTTTSIFEGEIKNGKLVAKDETPSELKVETVKAITDTKVQVTFNKEIDALSGDNILIKGLAVTGVDLAEDKKSAIITTALGTAGASYELTISGVKVDGKDQEAYTTTYTVPDATSLYQPKLTIKDEQTVLKADGKSQVLVTFELTDNQGQVITDSGKVEVAFTSTFGNFGEKRVTVQNGVAQAIFTSESLTEAKTALLTATVVEAENKNIINLKAERNVLLDPNPNTDEVDETVGATLTDIAAYQADRVVLYFNKDVDITKFTNKAANGDSLYTVNPNALDLKVWTGVTNAEARDEKDYLTTTGKLVAVKGLLPVPGNSKALYALLNVEANPANALTDNANVKVKAVDKTAALDVTGYKSVTLTDARVPAMLDVQRNNLKEIKVVFSEPVNAASADDAKNWVIDGVRLDNATVWGAGATAKVGEFNTTTGVDARHIVTITLGTKAGEQVYFKSGAHSVQGSNIGDWANLSDAGNNVLNTQTLDFVVPVDNAVPTAEVEVQSPEQYIVNFDKELTNAGVPVTAIKLQKRVVNADGTVTWVNETKQGIRVKQIGTSTEYKVETKLDWTDTAVYNTNSTNKNYYNDVYRLHVAKDAVKAAANGKGNEEINLVLGGAMTTPDVSSPKITAYDVEKQIVTMSEPVKFPAPGGDNLDTNAQEQTSIPTPTADFIGKDENGNFVTIPAKPIKTTFTNDYDTEFKVEPSKTLTAGEWTLVVRSISDDVGNTAASEEFKFTIEKEVAPITSKDFRVIWAYADTFYNVNADGVSLDATPGLPVQQTSPTAGKDAVYVKFNKPVKLTGQSENALATSNYTLNGAALPTGTQIVGNIVGYDDKDEIIDSVTIVLPDGTLSDAETTVITVSEYLQSADGETLTNGGQFKLSHNINVLTNPGSYVTLTAGTPQENLTKLQAALANDAIRKITLDTTGFTLPAGTEIKVDRLVDLDLGGNTYKALTVNTTEGGMMTVANGTLTDLTVDTPNADFTAGTGLTVTGTTTIKDVLSSTFTNKGTLAAVVITDANGTSFVNDGTVTGTVTVDTTGEVTLGGTGTITDVEVTKAAKVTVAAGATVTTLTAKAKGVELTGTGTVTNKKVDGGTIVDAKGEEVKAEATGDQEAQEAVEAEALKITTAPAIKDAKLALPTVAEGYTVAIKSSSNEAVISLKNEVTPQDAKTTVDVVLEVSKTVGNTTYKADTKSFAVIVPAKAETPSETEADKFTETLEAVAATVKTEVTKEALEAAITNLPEDATTDAAAFTPDTKGEVTKEIKITFADKSTKTVTVTVNVAEADAEAEAKLQAAQTAVAALFADETKAALADGVDQTAIDAAQTKLDLVAEGTEKTALEADIKKAKGFLDAKAEAEAKVLSGEATVEDYATAGVTGVTAENLAEVKAAVAAAVAAADPALTTVEDVQTIVEEVIAALALQKSLTTAKDYKYTGANAYTYSGTITTADNATTATYEAGKNGQDTINDLARYLGALHRSDDSTVSAIKYADKTYTWDPEGTLKGSNWKDGTLTLVKAIDKQGGDEEVISKLETLNEAYTINLTLVDAKGYEKAVTYTIKKN